ncbi:hypothetical protein ACS0TY_030295 [Phlomoides rotata]
MATPSDTEEDTIDLGTQATGENRGGSPICLVDRLCTNRPFNVYALIDVMLKGFKAKGKVTAREWGSEQPSLVTVTRASFWAGLYDLPMDCHNEATLKTLARRIGILEAFDPPANNLGSFLRFKVELDMKLPSSGV